MLSIGTFSIKGIGLFVLSYGRLMEEFIAAQRLTVLNDGEQGPTYQAANGSPYIDVWSSKGLQEI